MGTRVFKPRVAENCSAPGTSAFSLSSALTAHVRFSSACSTGDTVDYHAVAVDGSGVPTGLWEEGVGTYSAANTLTRTTIKNNSSGTTSAINFSSGNVVVMLTPNAERLARTAMEFVSEAVASSSSAIIFTNLSTDYNYEIRFDAFVASVSPDLFISVSTDNGSTWKTGASDYARCVVASHGSGAVEAVVATSDEGSLANITDAVICLTGATLNRVSSKGYDGYGSSQWLELNYTNTGTVNAIRLINYSGVITSGSFRLYRIKRGY